MGLLPRRLAWPGLVVAAALAVASVWFATPAGAATPTVTGVASGNGSSPATVTWTITSPTPITMFVYGYTPYGTSTLSYNGAAVQSWNGATSADPPTPIAVGPAGTQLVQTGVPCGSTGLSALVDVFELIGIGSGQIIDVAGTVDTSTCPVPPPPPPAPPPPPVTQPTSGSPVQPVTQPTSSSPEVSGAGAVQPTTAAATTPTTHPTPQLAFTGANSETTAGIGVGLLALGGGLVLAARRRRVGRSGG